MRVIDLAVKDLVQLVRDRMTAFFLVIMPVVFTLMFGFAFGGFDSGEEDPRLPVGYLDRDGGFLASQLLALLDTSTVVRVVDLDPSGTGLAASKGRQLDADAERQVSDGDLAAAAIVPAGYSQGLAAGALASLPVIVDPASSGGTAAQQEIAAVTMRLAGAVEAAQLSAGAYAEQAGFVDDVARRVFLEDAAGRAIAAWQDPPVRVAETASGALTTEAAEPSVSVGGFGHVSPAMMVQFAIAGLIGAGSILVFERKSGALRRLLTTAISRGEILLGHYLAMVVMILGQLLILAAFGQLALGVDYMRAPLAVFLVMLATALWTASLGLLIGAVAKNDDQVTIFSLIPMFVLAGLGGAWLPLELTGPTFQAIAHVLPTAWSMDGFENIVIRGLGLNSVLPGVGVMLAYAAVLFGLAVWRFRFD